MQAVPCKTSLINIGVPIKSGRERERNRGEGDNLLSNVMKKEEYKVVP